MWITASTDSGLTVEVDGLLNTRVCPALSRGVDGQEAGDWRSRPAFEFVDERNILVQSPRAHVSDSPQSSGSVAMPNMPLRDEWVLFPDDDDTYSLNHRSNSNF